MAKSVHGKAVLELTNAGQRTVFDVSGVDLFSVSSSNNGLMGSAVAELRKVVGGFEVSYSPVKTITSSSASLVASDVNGIDRVALVVTTKDSAAPDMVAAYYGEETQ